MFIVFMTHITYFHKPSEERQKTENDGVRIAAEMHAEFWSVSAKTGKQKNLLLHIPHKPKPP